MLYKLGFVIGRLINFSFLVAIFADGYKNYQDGNSVGIDIAAFFLYLIYSYFGRGLVRIVQGINEISLGLALIIADKEDFDLFSGEPVNAPEEKRPLNEDEFTRLIRNYKKDLEK